MGDALPLDLSKVGVFLSLFDHCAVNESDELLTVLRRRDVDLDLVPHPLAGCREIEALAGEGEFVEEGDSPARWATCVCRLGRPQQAGAKEANFNHLSSHAVDFNPISHPY